MNSDWCPILVRTLIVIMHSLAPKPNLTHQN